jgi:flavin reductase (DIM6/NTAB) family NADH-FMN oxidoreductase RutF
MNPSSQEFREALGRWASGVCIVACRNDGRTIATTVSAFTSLSLDPPLVLVALGPNATVLPFLKPGAAFGISILAAAQRRLATVFADPFPVGPDPFTPGAVPLINDALVALECTVDETRSGGDHVLILARVHRIVPGADAPPLIRFRRTYHGLDG